VAEQHEWRRALGMDEVAADLGELRHQWLERRDRPLELVGRAFPDAQKERDSPSSNLLSAQKNWHGLQPYNFVGRDLAQGSGKSIFGSHRELKLEARKLLVQMDISNVKVSPLSNGDYQIDELEITVAVENLPA